MSGPRFVARRFALPDDFLHEGGYAQVYKARDLADAEQREVAVKIFRNRRPIEDAVLIETWNRELAAYQALSGHPHIVDLIDWGHDDGEGNRYIVFEWIPSDLLDLSTEYPYGGWDSFAPVALGILDGLAAVHRAGYVHRDIKPENVLIDSFGVAKVADFGISRAKDFFHLGLTLAPYGTPPYMPPEAVAAGGSSEPTFAYDVYAFGILVVRVLGGEILHDRDAVLARLDDPQLRLDLPPDIADFLRRTLALLPEHRPTDATVALAELNQIQARRSAAQATRREVFISIATTVERVLHDCLSLLPEEVAPFVIEDLTEGSALYFDDRESTNDPDLMIAAGAFLYRCRRHATRIGVLAMVNASRLAPSHLERLRAEALRLPIDYRLTDPISPNLAREELDGVYFDVSQSAAERLERRSQEREQEAFRVWRSILEAKRRIENERGTPVRYRSFRIEDNRVVFTVEGPVPDAILNEPRLVRVGQRVVVAGEIEEVAENRVRLFVTRGDASGIRESGILEYDSELAKVAIDRQKRALDAVRFHRALRPDLATLLLDPGRVAAPSDLIDVEFLQDIDESKRTAVQLCLSSRDMVVVEGPPGTGKTTFIAELIAQFCRRNPGSRVIIASQTHVALDNALVRIREVAPGLRLIRVGRSDRMSATVEDLRLEHQLEAWRDPVLARGRAFLRTFARRLGIEMPDVDVAGLANQLASKRSLLHDRRSLIGVRQAERRRIAEQIAELNSLAPDVFASAAMLEVAARASSLDGLREAATAFVEQALDLASRLEGGNELTDRLVELEQSLTSLQDELRAIAGEEEQLRSELAGALGLDASADSDSILNAAAAGGSSGDPRFEKLRSLHADWELRFGRHPAFNGALMASADVVAATCVGLAGVPGAADVPFDLCIIDEASKATATEVLVPMARSRQWVLVGDRNQLPPFQEDALDDHALLRRYDLSAAQVAQTLFDVLAERLPAASRRILTVQYRMVPAIGDLISDCFYNSGLRSVDRDVSAAVRLAMQSPVLWMDTTDAPNHAERSSGTSFVNIAEARLIRRFLDRLNFAAKSAGEQLEVGVLTGYAAQVDEMTRSFAGHIGSWSALTTEVSTVDAFQGREVDVAVFSLTRSSAAGSLGFLRSDQRVNVALSRGRDGLVIVGDATFIRSGPPERNPLQRVLDYIDATGTCGVEKAVPE